jgi:rod shape determining protein RodA
MMATHLTEKRALWPTIKPYFTVFDGTLTLIIGLIMALSLVTMYSAGVDFPGRMEDHIRNILLSLLVMWAAALVPPQMLMRFAVPLYTLGIALLVAVAMFGIIKKGAQRWVNVGVVIQPSELMKIATPLMLAWWFQKREGIIHWQEFLVAGVLLMIPVALIMKQPDLGTSLLVGGSGFFVIFLAGLPWKVLFTLGAGIAAFLPIGWAMMYDYQRTRVLTLLDPTTDPLGKGFHIIQSMIAIGSGGLSGKGWMNGTQGQLQFIPERTTDFIFAVYSEEFGLIGNVILLILFLLLIGRGLLISANAPTLFGRLLAGALSLMFFTYAFVNMGMVAGILPVVGVPLPFMSYGGTAFVTLGLGVGMLMSIQRHRKLMQS